MVLIADSGSTKTDWGLLDGKKSDSIQSRGINPFFLNRREIEQLLKKELLPKLKQQNISEIYFYGAGCSNKNNCNKVKSALKTFFPKASIHVEHDLLAAARATCLQQEGIACILGTGSNSCYYDGKEIIKNIPALGYILGDEGSGAYMGKKLIQAYLYKELPSKISGQLEKKYKLNKEKILSAIYQSPLPNRYLPSFAPFLSANSKNVFIKKIITDSFRDFITHHISKYTKHKKMKIHFVGSVAWHFRSVLAAVLKKNEMQCGNIIASPIEKLAKYHSLQNNRL